MLAKAADAGRVPMVLGFCIVVCAGLAFLSGLLASASIQGEEAGGLASKARMLAGHGIAAANAAIDLDPAWGGDYGAGRFEPDPLDPRQVQLRIKADSSSCESLVSSARAVGGLDAIEASSRRIWSKESGALKKCPSRMEAAVLVFSLPSSKR